MATLSFSHSLLIVKSELVDPDSPLVLDGIAAVVGYRALYGNRATSRDRKKPEPKVVVDAATAEEDDGDDPAAAAAVAVPRRYRGVRKQEWGRWSAAIRDRVGRCRHWLGTDDTAEEAARAYDAAARRMRGSKERILPAAGAASSSSSFSPDISSSDLPFDSDSGEDGWGVGGGEEDGGGRRGPPRGGAGRPGGWGGGEEEPGGRRGSLPGGGRGGRKTGARAGGGRWEDGGAG